MDPGHHELVLQNDRDRSGLDVDLRANHVRQCHAGWFAARHAWVRGIADTEYAPGGHHYRRSSDAGRPGTIYRLRLGRGRILLSITVGLAIITVSVDSSVVSVPDV